MPHDAESEDERCPLLRSANDTRSRDSSTSSAATARTAIFHGRPATGDGDTEIKRASPTRTEDGSNDNDPTESGTTVQSPIATNATLSQPNEDRYSQASDAETATQEPRQYNPSWISRFGSAANGIVEMIANDLGVRPSTLKRSALFTAVFLPVLITAYDSRQTYLRATQGSSNLCPSGIWQSQSLHGCGTAVSFGKVPITSRVVVVDGDPIDIKGLNGTKVGRLANPKTEHGRPSSLMFVNKSDGDGEDGASFCLISVGSEHGEKVMGRYAVHKCLFHPPTGHETPSPPWPDLPDYFGYNPSDPIARPGMDLSRHPIQSDLDGSKPNGTVMTCTPRILYVGPWDLDEVRRRCEGSKVEIPRGGTSVGVAEGAEVLVFGVDRGDGVDGDTEAAYSVQDVD